MHLAAAGDSDGEQQQFVRPTAADSRMVHRSPRRRAPGCCFWTFVALLTPAIVPLVLAWGALGIAFTQHPLTLLALGAACFAVVYISVAEGALGAFLAADFGSAFFVSSLWDFFAISLVALALLALTIREKNRRRRAVWGVGIVLSATTLMVLKLALFRPTAAISKSAARAALASAVVMPCVALVSALRLWRPASRERLAEAEDELLRCGTMKPYSRAVVAGLGTVAVPAAPLGSDTVQRGAALPEVHRSLAAHPEVVTPDSRPALVLIHGYGAGNGFWAMNLDSLSDHFQVYALDWLGVGLSDRPPFRAEAPEQAEAFFVDAIERWRQEMGIESFVLVGHSLGALLSASYAIRFPHRVQHLVLASPAGVPHAPAPRHDLPLLFRVVRALWPYVTPMAIVRFLGPAGPWVVRKALAFRLRFLPDTSAMRNMVPLDLLSEYTYQNWARKGSGEYAMNSVLSPGAYARLPLRDRITRTSVPMPLTFIYGGTGDWMDFRHAVQLMQTLEMEGKPDVQLFLVESAGHQVFMDNPADFNLKVLVALGQDVVVPVHSTQASAKVGRGASRRLSSANPVPPTTADGVAALP